MRDGEGKGVGEYGCEEGGLYIIKKKDSIKMGKRKLQERNVRANSRHTRHATEKE